MRFNFPPVGEPVVVPPPPLDVEAPNDLPSTAGRRLLSTPEAIKEATQKSPEQRQALVWLGVVVLGLAVVLWPSSGEG